MNEDMNIGVIRKLFDHLNMRDLDASDPNFGEEYLATSPSWPSPFRRDQVKAALKAINDAFPDCRFEIRDIIAQGDKVVATWEITGTHTNAFTSVIGETIPATNKKIKVAASTLYEFKDGSLIRQDTYLDQYALLSQLGALGVAQG